MEIATINLVLLRLLSRRYISLGMTPPEQLNLRLETNLASQDKDTRELGRIKPSLGSVINFALWPVVREKMHC